MGVLGRNRRKELADLADWGEVTLEDPLPDPDPTAEVCGPCGGNPIWWSDPYGGRHCAGCAAPPARPLVKSIDVCIKLPGGEGMAWEDQTEKLWPIMWDLWDPQEDEDDGF